MYMCSSLVPRPLPLSAFSPSFMSAAEMKVEPGDEAKCVGYVTTGYNYM